MTIGDAHYLSLAVVRLAPVTATGECLMTGTGFFVRVDEIAYLVTNYHVVTWVSPGGTLLAGLELPLEIKLSVNLINSSNSNTNRQKFSLPLYDDRSNPDDPQDPLFHLHPDGRTVDLIALRLPRLDPGLEYRCISLPLDVTNDDLSVMDEVSMPGFPHDQPYGYSDPPIYKRGSIASEPRFHCDRFFVDGKTRPGMSGAPVLRHWIKEVEKIDNQMVVKTGRTKLIGIYSGRDQDGGADLNELELGIAWKVEKLRELFASLAHSERCNSCRK